MLTAGQIVRVLWPGHPLDRARFAVCERVEVEGLTGTLYACRNVAYPSPIVFRAEQLALIAAPTKEDQQLNLF